MTQRNRALWRPSLWALGVLLIASALLIGLSVADSTAASPATLGVYSCCGWESCSVLAATSACPSGDTQCEHVVNQDGVKAKCCVNYCNDPHPVEPRPH